MTLTDLFGKLFTFLSMIFFTILLFKLYDFKGAIIGIPVGYILGNILFYIIIMTISLFKTKKKRKE
jgi:hypothetical protein